MIAKKDPPQDSSDPNSIRNQELLYQSCVSSSGRKLTRKHQRKPNNVFSRDRTCWCEEFGQMPNETEPTSESFVAKENEQLLKNVKTKERNSFGANSKE